MVEKHIDYFYSLNVSVGCSLEIIGPIYYGLHAIVLFLFLKFENNKFFFCVSRLVLLKFCYCTLTRYYCLLSIV